MLLNNYHTHTKFCDGSTDPENYVKKAIEYKMHSLGFSAHAPLPFEAHWSIKKENLPEYCNTIKALKEKYAEQIKIYLSLEMDYIPDMTVSFADYISQYKLDYSLGSIHLVRYKNNNELWFIDGPQEGYIKGLKDIFNDNIQLAVKSFYEQTCEMIKTQKPQLIGHLDKIKMNNKGRFFNEDEQWYKDIVHDTIKYIASTDSIVEINTRGIYKHRTESLFPSDFIIKQCYQYNIPICVNSDTHVPNELINYFDETFEILKHIGYKKIYYFENGNWLPQSI